MDIRDVVREAARRGVHIDRIDEEIIQPSILSDDQKAALWLYAWSCQSPRRQHDEAATYLIAVMA